MGLGAMSANGEFAAQTKSYLLTRTSPTPMITAGGTRTFIESKLPTIVRGGRQMLARDELAQGNLTLAGRVRLDWCFALQSRSLARRL